MNTAIKERIKVLGGTYHESYFDEITVEGTLEEFLFRLVSATEYQESIDKLAISLQARK